jgi:hypothetical protein
MTADLMPPTTVFETNQRLSILIHAGSKVGKSTTSATAPKPILVLDAEGSWRFIPLRQVPWDPTTGPPPTYDGSWDACVVTVNQWETVKQVYDWVAQYQTPFTSIVIDSITEIQRRCKSKLVGDEAMKIADWGILLARMDSVIRGFRDLALNPYLSVRCVVFIAETRQSQSGKWVPYMQGQISVSLPYWVDICGYLYPDWEVDGNGQPTLEIRRLWITPSQQFEAGERVQGRLGGALTLQKAPVNTVGTDIEDWMKIVFGVPATPVTVADTTMEGTN